MQHEYTTVFQKHPGFITATVAAAMIGKSTSVLRAYSERFGFPKPKWIGHTMHYCAAEVEAWLASDDRYKPAVLTGEDHHNCKWPAATVARAVELYAGGKGLSLGLIAQQLRIPKATIHKWVNGERRAFNEKDVAARTEASAKAATKPPKRRELPQR